jgi:hypothetical protein
MLEAPCMDVSALAVDPGMSSHASRELDRSSSGPACGVSYPDRRCGATFQTAEEFRRGFATLRSRPPGGQPQRFIFARHLDAASDSEAWEAGETL